MTFARLGNVVLATALTMALLPASVIVAQGSPLSDAEADALIADIEAQVAEAEAALEELGSVRMDAGAAIEAVGSDPEAIADWVAQETRWVPYLGALRGPAGVLMDGLGNGLDRALPLAQLLAAAGQRDPILMRTSLPLQLADRLASRELQRMIALEGDDPADETRERRGSVSAAADRLVRMLGLDERIAGDPPPTATEAMVDHWWVRIGDGDQPLDLDPIFGDQADERPPAIAAMPVDEVPDDLRHAVTIRVLIERLGIDGLTEETVLEHRIPLGEPGQRWGDLRFDPDLGDVELPKQDAKLLDIAAAPFWRPVLVVDGEPITGEWFDTDGRLEGPGKPALGSALDQGGSALGALGGGDDADTRSRLTAAWIEYTSEGPGRPPRVERRELFDVISDDRDGEVDKASILGRESLSDTTRRGLALLGDTSILILGATVDEATLLDAFYRDVIESRSGRIATVFMAAGRDDERIVPSIAQTDPRPIALMVMSRLREWWSADPGRIFVTQPTVLSTYTVLSADETQGSVSVATDVVMNDVGALGAGRDAGFARVRQGMLDTLIEAESLGNEA